MKPQQLSDIFARFVGREIAVEETTVTDPAKYPGRRDVPVAVLKNPDDPLVVAMREAAQEHIMGFRLRLPGEPGFQDSHVDLRVNGYGEKGADGKWRVSKRFDIG
jgi:hypothetical protein